MEDVQGFFREFYTPRNATLAIVGDNRPLVRAGLGIPQKASCSNDPPK